MSRKVLDVGQCNADNSRISSLLKKHFDVEIDRSHSHDEAIKAALDTPYDLILINRILDADSTAGMDILASLKTKPSTAETPVMVVSNYQETQEEAVSRGAVPGFGKSELDAEETIAKLALYLGEPD